MSESESHPAAKPSELNALLVANTATIERLWETSNHGTRREDVEAAFVAGALAEREACAALCEELCTFDMDDPGQTAADAIRTRTAPNG